MKRIHLLWLIGAVSILFGACRKEHPTLPTQNVRFLFDDSESTGVCIKNIMLTLTNKNTGEVKKTEHLQSDASAQLTIPFGIYDIEAKGKAYFTGKETTFSGQLVNQSIDAGSGELHIGMQPELLGDFVIREMCYGGAPMTDSHQVYRFGCYVAIHNNTDHVLYADSLVWAGTAANTNIPQDVFRPLLPQGVVVECAFMIPGNGKSHPVKPGEDFIICMEAKNHNLVAPKLPDMSRWANFEWYEPNDRFQLTDNPLVPNMDILYKLSWSITPIHMRGFESYFIFKLPKSKEKFLEENIKTFTFKAGNSRVYPVIPTEWIIDGVELYSQKEGCTKALPASVDKSHTFCTPRLGYTIQRKVARTAQGRKIYRDTNDSMNDFERDVRSSLL